jgi:hypothetical protein
MSDSVKIQVKLGDAEFNAEGPEAIVKAAFEEFLRARELAAQAPPSTPSAIPPTPEPNGRRESEPSIPIDQGLLDRVFQKYDDIVSLRMLPSSINPDWQADSVILLLYGFWRLANVSEVPVTKLNQGLRRSGIGVIRVDGIVDVHKRLYMKGGVRSGGHYTLNTQGKATAERWLKEHFN